MSQEISSANFLNGSQGDWSPFDSRDENSVEALLVLGLHVKEFAKLFLDS